MQAVIETIKRLLAAVKGLGGALADLASGDFRRAFTTARDELSNLAGAVGSKWAETFEQIVVGGAAAFRELKDDIARQVDDILGFALDVAEPLRAPGVSNAPAGGRGQAPVIAGSEAAARGAAGRAPLTDAQIRADFLKSMAEQERETLIAIDLLKEDHFQKDLARLSELQTFHQTFASVVITAHQGWLTLLSNATNTVMAGLSSAVQSIVFGTRSAAEAFKELGKQMVGAVVDFMVQKVAAFALEKALAAASKSLLAGQLVATNAIAQGYASTWAPAATLALIGSYGAAAAFASLAPTLSALNQGIAVAQTAGGLGFAGFASGVDRVPMDMPAVVHRGERIVQADVNADLTDLLSSLRDGRSGGGSMVVEINLDGDTLARGIGRMSDEGRLTINARSIT